MKTVAELTASELAADLRRLGLHDGASVLVHSSLRALGWVAGGAPTVVAALEDVVGAKGTVLVPTFTGGPELSPSRPPVFDPAQDAGWTGAVTETLRQRRGAVRSLHPTHSVAALGRRAHALIDGHINSTSPCDNSSPFARLAALADGYVLLLGVDHESNTMFHHVEELAESAYHLQRCAAVATIVLDGTTVERSVVLHRYGTPRRFMVVEELLCELGAQTIGRVGNAEARLVHARAMVAIVVDALRANPDLLIDSHVKEASST